MTSRIAVFLWVMGSLLASLRAAADDIDLFVGRSLNTTEPPNVLIVLDNQANWTPEERQIQQREAISDVIDKLYAKYPSKFNLGLMMYTETGGTNIAPDGGYVRSAIRLMDLAGSNAYKEMINNIDFNADKASNSKAGLLMAEAYLYYLGGNGAWEVPYAGNNKNKTDYTGNVFQATTTPCCAASSAVWALPGNALDNRDSTRYNSPVVPGSCAKNYIIFIGNSPASDTPVDKTTSLNILRNMTGVTTTADIVLPNATVDSKRILADEWARFMVKDSPLKIRTLAIDVQIVSRKNQCLNNQPLAWSEIMDSMATDIPDVRTYFNQCDTAFDKTKFTANLLEAFDTILSRNSVFASVALPAAANEQSTFLNQVYIGMFRPDAGAFPRWQGNLKQYKLDIQNNELRLVDSTGAAAVETNTEAKNAGFIKGCAVSYWKPSGTETSPYYWDYLKAPPADDDPVTNCSTAGDAGSNFPDGQIVEKGGQAAVMRATLPANRKVLTCNSDPATCNGTGLVTFNTTNVSTTDLGVSLTTERDQLVSWAIGADVDLEKTGSTTSKMRPSVHGDIVHSQPVAINYSGSSSTQEIVVYYGGNDGMLRAVNGNQTLAQNSGTVAAGQEFWAFMAPEFYKDIKRLRNNTAKVQFPSSGATAGLGVPGLPKGYGMDGTLSAYEFDTSTIPDNIIDKRGLLAGMRRASRMIYSFDVTSKTAPLLNWKVGCPNLVPDPVADLATCNTGFADAPGAPVTPTLGQTWSRPTVAYAQGYDAPNPLIITGGGYDNCEDNDDGMTQNNNCTATSTGNGIFVLDAATGAVITSFLTDRAVPGAVTVVPVSDSNRRAMYVYAADTGGNVYRISGGTVAAPAEIGNTAPVSWVMKKIASLGCNTATACNPSRKFLFGPDIFRIPGGDKLGIVLGSGDREKPLLDFSVTVGVPNYFYTLIDQPTNATWLDDLAATCGGAAPNIVICHDALTTVATGPSFNPNLAISQKGWKLPLRAGEQVVTGAITVDNVVNFSTHIPAVPTSCEAEYGVATAYKVDFADASGSTTNFLGGGLVPTPVAGKVIINGVPVPFCIGCGDEGSPIGAGKVGGGISWTQPKSRVFWNIDQVDD